jgi:Pentose-5-phosphate-3-epimerase
MDRSIKNQIVISPSMASANQLNLAESIEIVNSMNCKDIHIDIEDGNFTPNITFGIKTITALRSITSIPFSFHLMVTEQEFWLRKAATLNPSIIFGHYEALCYPRAFIGLSKELEVRCGMALNPKTPVEGMEYILSDLDGILLLSVEPDGIGENFIPQVLSKAEKIRSLSPDIEIWIDGNITYDMLPCLQNYSITHAVMGRGFFKYKKQK